MRRSIGSIAIATLLLGSGCALLDKKPAGMPMAQLLKEGKAPVEVSSLGRSIGPIPAFQASIRNLSDKQVQAVKWTAVFSSSAGAPLKEGPSEGGFAEFGGIKPGETLQGAFAAPGDSAAVKFILKEVIYEDKVKEFKIDKIWKNPRHNAEVQLAEGASAGKTKG